MAIPGLSHPDDDNTKKYTNSSHDEKQFDHVMCFGTFDILHPGHIFYLSEAQKFAMKMTIIVARDKKVLSIKKKFPLDTEEKRCKNVQKAFPLAQVILGDEYDIFAPIRTLKPDILVFGYDQHVPVEKIRELFPDIAMEHTQGFETEKWKSSILRKIKK